jgi:endo-1,4-beta-xylanase
MKAAKAPIDAIGCQAHDACKIATATVKSNLDKLAATGLPIFITEYDIGLTDDAAQPTGRYPSRQCRCLRKPAS